MPRRKRMFVLACLLVAGLSASVLLQGGSQGRTATRALVTSWSRPGTKPMSDAGAARLVSPAREIVPDNADANRRVPTRAQLKAFRSSRTADGQTEVRFNPLTRYVTGRPGGLRNPSTDELIQWVSHKWGIPTDLIRAQQVLESHWRQSFRGDRHSVSSDWYRRYPPQARVGGSTDVYQSLGITQVKWTPDGAIGAGTEPLRWRSTAFNLDYYAATVRYYYDGRCNWCEGGYGAGQAWNSAGAWYSPQPWGNDAASSYVADLQRALRNRSWTRIGR